MLIAYGILLVLYIGLALLYALTRKDPVSIPSWPLLTLDESGEPVGIDCVNHGDCPQNHVCINKKCVPKFLKDGACDDATGQWALYELKGRFFAICKCTDEKLFTQRVFGANCNVSVACGVHGKYNLLSKTCDCDPGYVERDLQCRKMFVMEYQRTQPCASDEIKVSQLPPDKYPFHEDYVKSLDPEDCVKNPCTFDAFTGRPLKAGKAFHKKDWGCVCDPSYGLFGVQLVKGNQYLQEEGFDACASIFKEDPEDAIDVKLITYFYIRNLEPLSIILFENLPEDKLQPLFQGMQGQFMLNHSFWRYDFAQYFFSERPIRIRIRAEDQPKSYRSVERFYLEYYENFSPEPCDQNVDLDMDLKTANWVLYRNPICKAPSNDPMYGDRYLVRPEHIYFQKYIDDTPRYNAFVLEYEADTKRWSVDLDYPYKVDFYREEAKHGRLGKIAWLP